jgi:glycosyltransferase involved in cell wall biosynthesis
MRTGVVTTIIPVFNRAQLLREAVMSVIGQTYRPIEIIIVDDGSTDDTQSVCRELISRIDEPIRLLSQANGGPGAAREAGRLAADGEFLQYLDSDDLLYPRKFAVQVAALRRSPDCGIAYCKTREYVMGSTPVDLPSARTGEQFDKLFPLLLTGRCWQTVTPLIRRSVSDLVGPWSDLRQEEDWEYDARIAANDIKLVWCPEFLADFRHHEGARASGGSFGNPRKMQGRARAHRLVYEQLLRAQVPVSDVHRQSFARSMFLLARQCGASGLSRESRDLFALAREASGRDRARGYDFLLYYVAARCFGWCNLGRFTCWCDQWRNDALRSRKRFT